ncbi:hypothetical protein TWF173_010748 [Orbilia oligospora]|uniref:Uncharacterized protein n=1 Tax=Orbilia oligospora TaxID=2813651 RepID=A0A7C8VPG3_ORBOL|nr:hypothetical protein TWF970_004018 [Orbilia oligospora]KAF3309561.1 hypothetical protein TWF173_010748 [Orbilia oligospora]
MANRIPESQQIFNAGEMWVIEVDGLGGGHRIRNQKPLVVQYQRLLQDIRQQMTSNRFGTHWMHYFASQQVFQDQDEISGRWLCRPIRVFTSSDGVETAQVSYVHKL